MEKTKNKAVTRLTFFHPDFTVGPGVTPDPVMQGIFSLAPLVGSTTDRELLSRIHNVFDYSPCPEGCQASAICFADLKKLYNDYNPLSWAGQYSKFPPQILDKITNLK